MIIVQFNGGLGNQLFQYAAGKSLSLHHHVPLLLDTSMFYRDELPELEVPRSFELYNFEGVIEKIITIEERTALIKIKEKKIFFDKLVPKHKRNLYIEPHYHFDKNFFSTKKTVLLKGGWQSEKYFKRYKDTIRQVLTLKQEIIQPLSGIAKEIREKLTIGVHIRRGDYLRKPIIHEWHGVMPKDYYAKGFEIISKIVTNFAVLYFTDDPEWVQKELIPLMNGQIISTQNHFRDFYLLSLCHHNIIANSSFSWWAAWLNTNPGKIVIAPKKWFDQGPKDVQDVIPADWITI